MVYNNIPKNLNKAINQSCFDSYKLFGRDTYKNNSIPLKIYDKNEAYDFLNDFIKERDKVLTPAKAKHLENYKNTVCSMFRSNNVPNIEKRIEDFNAYVNTSISKMFTIEIDKVEIPLSEHEQKLFAALNSDDVMMLSSNTEPLSENFIKEICLSDKLNDSAKVMGLTILKVDDAASVLDKIVKENSTVKRNNINNENKNKNTTQLKL